MDEIMFFFSIIERLMLCEVVVGLVGVSCGERLESFREVVLFYFMRFLFFEGWCLYSGFFF